MQADDVAHVGDLLGLLGRCDAGTFVNWGFFAPSVWSNAPHRHSFAEVCFAYAGSGRFTTGGVTHRVRAGQVFLARTGAQHQVVADERDPLGICFWSFVPDAGPWSVGLADGPAVVEDTGSLGPLLLALSAEARSSRHGRQEVLRGLGTALLVESARVFARPGELATSEDRPPRGVHLVATMRQHLLDNLAGPVTVADVAGAVHLSERHAQRVFADATGESLMVALRRMRLERAATMLRETDGSVAAVARACGYADADAFAAAFRRHHGRTPSALRT